MQPLESFKRAHHIETLNFYPSTKGSGRYVAGVPGGRTLVTTVGFDPKKPAFVYDNPVALEDSYILSNVEQKDATFTM